MPSLYGTDEPPAQASTIAHGRVRLTLQGAALRHVHVDGIEVIRSVAFLVRDRDWGTVEPQIGPVVTRQDGDALHLALPLTFRNGDAALQARITVAIRDGAISVLADARATGAFMTNRTGFTVLYPIDGVAGADATVTHSDGATEVRPFPLRIAPWQPFMDIAELRHRAGELSVRCRFVGDVFEMEDQRQWGDASFKVYNRPLALPWPYLLPTDTPLRQSVEIDWSPAPVASRPVATPPRIAARFPQTSLALTAADARNADACIAAIERVRPQCLLCHVDATAAPVAAQMTAFAALQTRLADVALDLELICRFDGTQSAPDELRDHAQAMTAAGLSPASVLICPSVDRQSTPPGSDWPDCPPLDQIHAAAAKAFPDLSRGGGMASFFPELNRKPPPSDMLDFVTHGLCPIVHAADDLSVIETLQAIPHITRSARAIAGRAEYRIGPATIAMRQNPYGSRTIPNPLNCRVCMTDDDPRHRAAFGAAYALGLATALAPAGLSVWTPAEVLGPRGVAGDWPITDLLACLAGLAGAPVHEAVIEDGIARLVLGTTCLRANLTALPADDLPPFGWTATEL